MHTAMCVQTHTDLIPVAFQGVIHCAMETAKLGPLAFYKVIWMGCGQ